MTNKVNVKNGYQSMTKQLMIAATSVIFDMSKVADFVFANDLRATNADK